jgi:hypothetical protein
MNEDITDSVQTVAPLRLPLRIGHQLGSVDKMRCFRGTVANLAS